MFSSVGILFLDYSVVSTVITLIFLTIFYLHPDKERFFLIQLIYLFFMIFYGVLATFFDIEIFLPGKTDDYRFYYGDSFNVTQEVRYSFFLSLISSIINLEESIFPFSTADGMRVITPFIFIFNIYLIKLIHQLFLKQSFITLLIASFIVLNPYIFITSLFNLRDGLVSVITAICLLRTFFDKINILDYAFIAIVVFLRPISAVVLIALIMYNLFVVKRSSSLIVSVAPVLFFGLIASIFSNFFSTYFYFLSDLSLVEERATGNIAGSFSSISETLYFFITSLYRVFINPINFESDTITSFYSVLGILWMLLFAFVFPLVIYTRSQRIFLKQKSLLSLFIVYAIGSGILSFISANVRHYVVSKYFVLLIFLLIAIFILQLFFQPKIKNEA